MATVTHELRTPTNGIIGNLILMKPFIPENSQLSFSVCLSSSKLLLNLINDILVKPLN